MNNINNYYFRIIIVFFLIITLLQFNLYSQTNNKNINIKKIDIKAFISILEKNKNIKSNIEDRIRFIISDQLVNNECNKINYVDINNFFLKNRDKITAFLNLDSTYLNVSKKYFIENKIPPGFRIIPILIYLNVINIDKKKNDVLGIWGLNTDFILKRGYKAFKTTSKNNKEALLDVRLDKNKTLLLLSEYLNERYSILSNNWFLTLIDFVCMLCNNNIDIKHLISKTKSNSFDYIKQYTNAELFDLVSYLWALNIYFELKDNNKYELKNDILYNDMLIK